MVLARLLEHYDSILMPFGENSRYDLLIEDGDRFIRVQCKTGRSDGSVVTFNACSITYHHPNRKLGAPTRHHYRGQADVFGVYCAELGRVYLVPVEDVGPTEGRLRVTPPLNGQTKLVRWARDYELGHVSGCSEAKMLARPG